MWGGARTPLSLPRAGWDPPILCFTVLQLFVGGQMQLVALQYHYVCYPLAVKGLILSILLLTLLLPFVNLTILPGLATH